MKRQTAKQTATAMLMHIAKAAFMPFTREGGRGVALVALVLTLAACNSGGGGSSNNNSSNTPSNKAELLSLKLNDGDTDHTVDIDGTDGSVTLPYSPDRPALTIASIAISEGATAALADNTDATADVNVSLDKNNKFTITVTGTDNATNTYTITIKTAPNDEAKLLSLKLNDGATDYTVDIRVDNKTGAVQVPRNTDLASLTIGAIEISDNATSSPARNESVSVNNSNQFTITVTAEDTTTTETYTITITLGPSNEAQLRALRIAGKEVGFAGTTGSVTLLYGTVLADITIDSISLSDEATADFRDAPGAKAGATIPALDDNKQFTITVKAEDGTTTETYTITIDDTPTLAVTGHYAEQRIGAGDFEKTDLLHIGNVQNGAWNYEVTVTGTGNDGASPLVINKTGDATASDSSFDTKALTADQWNMFHDTSPDNRPLMSVGITLWRSGGTKPASPVVSLGRIAKEQYLLKNWQDVQAINHDLAGDYTLMHDITFPEPGTDGMPTEGFDPIGEYKIINKVANHTLFTGRLNGNGHTLHNLFINRGSTDGVGLVAVLGTDASIDSLSLVLHANGIQGNNQVGALVGLVVSATISNSYATGDVSGDGDNVGGLVGLVVNATISNSYATGDVSGNRFVGGLAGNSTSSTISNSYATGDVSGNQFVGGLAGISSASTISNSYASGRVTADSSFGGLLGNGNAANSYWDNTVNGHITADRDSGRTTEQMKMQATFVGWDFTSDWGIDASINNGYPYLRGVGPQPAYAKQLLALSLQADTTADAKIAIDEANKTGAVQLSANTDTANIRISYIRIAGASASLAKGDTVTVSNNNFSITVTADDGTTQNYAIFFEYI